jgi:hypothetical protein
MESFAHPLRRAMNKFFDSDTCTDLVPWHLHNLRHTSKSFLVDCNVSHEDRSAIMGHSTGSA